jgi:hypothetical protein
VLTVRYPDRPPRSSPNGPSRSTEFAALAGISVAHLYNLRKSLGYVKARVHFTETTAPRTQPAIGVRRGALIRKAAPAFCVSIAFTKAITRE